MLRNFDVVIQDLSGSTVVDQDGASITLRSIAIGALMASYKDEQDISGDEKLSRYELAVKINKGGKVEITAEEISKLKKLIGKGFNVLAVGQAYKLLEAEGN